MTSRPFHSSMRRRRGVILLTIAWCILILSLVLLTQASRTEMDFERQRDEDVRLRLRYAAESAENQILAGMAEDAQKSETHYDAYSNEWGWLNLQERFGKDFKDAYPDVEINVAIEDEDSKINLLKASPETLQGLLQILGWPEAVAKPLAEEMLQCVKTARNPSEQDAAGNGGTQSQKDQSKDDVADTGADPSKNKCASAKNNGFFDLRCLLQIPALQRQLLNGLDLNFNGKLDLEEKSNTVSFPDGKEDGPLLLGLRRYITVVSDGSVNPNMAPLEVLLTVPGVSKRIAEEIVTKRQGADGVVGTKDDFVFKTVEDLKKLNSISKFTEIEYNKMAPYMRTTSQYYTIRICAMNHKTKQMFRLQTCLRRKDKGKIRILSHLEDNGF